MAACLLFAALTVIVKFSVAAPAIDADRDVVISKSLNEIHKTENVALENAGWADQSRGIVRLPIETAMRLTADAWQNPVQARADLIARAEKAAAPAPKVAPKPSQFE